jgi:hypothetical protein
VLAGGIDAVYPLENADLQRTICDDGLLLSDRSPGFAPRGKDPRNRLISGISLGGRSRGKVAKTRQATVPLDRAQGLIEQPGRPI